MAIAGATLDALVLSNLWRPQFYIKASQQRSMHDDETRPICQRRLIALGPQVIEPLVQEMGNGSAPELRSVLKEFGKPAHDQLMKAIENETDTLQQASRIRALQEAFGDYSQFALPLNSINQYPGFADDIERTLTTKWGKKPPTVFTDIEQSKVNPAFMRWYLRRMTPKGPLPRWKPSGEWMTANKNDSFRGREFRELDKAPNS